LGLISSWGRYFAQKEYVYLGLVRASHEAQLKDRAVSKVCARQMQALDQMDLSIPSLEKRASHKRIPGPSPEFPERAALYLESKQRMIA
jgi:hypothetical protein